MRKEFSAKEYKEALKSLGVAYLGSYKANPKIYKSKKVGEIVVYSVALAPADMSGYNVCPCSTHCKSLCLSFSGRARGDILMRGFKGSIINRARIKKTKLFFEDRDTFLNLMYYEIRKTQRYAERTKAKGFAVRINCMSDLDPELFRYKGEQTNILQEFDTVPFYDYTKVPAHLKLQEKYDNYTVVLSYTGHNWLTCERYLESGGNVAVVFDMTPKDFPVAFAGYPVLDGTQTDLRHLDPSGHVVALEFHRPATLYTTGHYIKQQTAFVVEADDPRNTYAFKIARHGVDE